MRLRLGIATLSLLSVAPPAVSQTVHYTLAPEVSGGDLTALRVEVRFRAGASGTTDFRWDDGWNAEHRLWQSTRDLNVAGARAVKRGADGHWRIPEDSFGPCATIVTEQRPVFARGFDAEATAAADNVVTGIDPRHPAYAAGLRNGMKILERTEGEPDNALVPYALLVEDRGAKRTIRYLSQGEESIAVQQMRIRQPDAAGCRRTLGGL